MDGLRTDLPILDSIGAYRLLKHLGANGPIQVYLARKEGPERSPTSPSADIVLRIVTGLTDEDAKKIEELRREAPAFCKLSHPAIIRTHEFFEHGNSLVFVHEYVDGMSLAELSGDGAPKGARAFSDDTAFQAVLSICDALTHAHGMRDPQGRSSPVLHKGISPSKARVTRDGIVKLGGFGLTKPFGVSIDRKAGRLQWESPYLAPEQILGQPPSPKVDVYAAGLILWELLTGRSSAIVVPKDLLALPSEMQALAERALDPLAKLRPDLPRALSAAVDAALVSSPDHRTIGCAELAQEIRKHSRVGRGKEELRVKVHSALSGTAPASTPTTPVEPSTTPRAIKTPRVDTPPAVAAASRRPPAPVQAPAPPRAPQEAFRLPAPPVAAAPMDPIGASPIVMIGAPSPRTPPPPPPKWVPAPEMSRPPPPLPPPAPSPVDSVTSATMVVPSSTEPPQGFAPAPSAALPASDMVEANPFGGRAAAALALSSFLQRLRAPRSWSRTARLATGIGVPLALASVMATIMVGRSRRSSQHEAQIATTAALADIRAAAPATTPPPASPQAVSPVQPSVVQDPSPQVPSPQVPSVQAPSAKAAAAQERPVAPALPAAKAAAPKAAKPPAATSTDGEFSMALKKKKLGHLTVHSTARYAKVYLMFTRFGRVEDKLTVPCGQRFIAIGVPPRPGRHEPVWLAPGQSVFVPCGGSLTVTMNPRRVR